MLTSEQIRNNLVENFNKIHKNKYDYLFVEDQITNNRTKVSIVCKKHGLFKQEIASHKRGRGCPSCFQENKIINTESFIKKAVKAHGGTYNYVKSKYIKSNIKVVIVCKKHGEFKQLPRDHVDGSGCPLCFGKNKLTKQAFLLKVKKIHGLKYDYLEQFPGTNNKEKIKIKCKKHDFIFQQTIYAHLRGQGCPKCANKIKNSKKTLTKEKFLEKCYKIHGKEKYNYSLVDYKNIRSNITIICCKHGSFKQSPSGHLQGNGCPKCFSKKYSKGQLRLFDFIEKKFQNKKIVLEQKIVIKNKTYYADIFIPDLNMIIEYFGDYWHCNPKKYKPDYFHKHKKSKAKNIWKLDQQRQKELNKNGYNVYIIWESDFVKNKKQTLKNICKLIKAK